MSAPVSSSQRGTRTRCEPPCTACTTTPSCATTLGANARRAVAAYSHEAWAEGMSQALSAVGKAC